MNAEAALAQDLKHHLFLCQEILAVVQGESATLVDPESTPGFPSCQARRQVLPRLKESLDRLKRHRHGREQRVVDRRIHGPEVVRLLQQCQDLTMRVIVLDRENEQALLRRSLVPPQHLPPIHRQRPRFVSELYRRHGA